MNFKLPNLPEFQITLHKKSPPQDFVKKTLVGKTRMIEPSCLLRSFAFFFEIVYEKMILRTTVVCLDSAVDCCLHAKQKK